MSERDRTACWPPEVGLLLVGHGTRELAGVAEFLECAQRIAGQTNAPSEPGFLEFAQPTIADALAALVRRGARRIVVAPLLLFAAGHAKRDIPDAVAAAAAENGVTECCQSEHLGCHEAIVRLSALRYRQAIADDPVSDDQTALVMVGRGSHDESATREMQRFVALRAQATPVGQARAGFVAMAEPRLSDVLDEAVASGARRIVVQPHLLFGGVLLERIGRLVDEYAERFGHIRWITAGQLGPSGELVEAVLGRATDGLAAEVG